MDSLKDILQAKPTVNGSNSSTVNSIDKSIDTVNSSNSIPSKEGVYLDGYSYTADGVAEELTEKLDDHKSLTYYRILAKENNPQVLLDILAYVLETDRLGKIRTTKAIYFMAMLRIRKIRTKYKKDD